MDNLSRRPPKAPRSEREERDRRRDMAGIFMVMRTIEIRDALVRTGKAPGMELEKEAQIGALDSLREVGLIHFSGDKQEVIGSLAKRMGSRIIDAATVLSGAMALLKFTGHIELSWWVVFSPVLIVGCFIFGAIGLVWALAKTGIAILGAVEIHLKKQSAKAEKAQQAKMGLGDE